MEVTLATIDGFKPKIKNISLDVYCIHFYLFRQFNKDHSIFILHTFNSRMGSNFCKNWGISPNFELNLEI